MASAGDLLVNNQKKNWEMVVNPGVDGYTKTTNQQKTLQKTQKGDDQLKTK